MTEGDSPPAPPQLMRTFWRGFIFFALAAFFTVSAMVMRGLVGGFGASFWPLVLAAMATLLAGLLVAPVASMVEMPEALFGHWLPERRAGRGGCPECGYSALHAPATECPECGAILHKPTPYSATWNTLRRGMGLALPAWIAGCALGFVIALRDEHSFTVETALHRNHSPDVAIFTRPRIGVAGFASLRWTPADGFTGPPPYESPKERNWKPQP